MFARKKGTMPRTSQAKRNINYGYLLILPAMAALCAIALYPFICAIILSFRALSYTRPGMTGQFVGVANYVKLWFGDPYFWHSMRITAEVVLISVPVEAAIGLGIALLLNREFKGKGVAVSLLLLPMLLSPAVVGVIWRFMLASGWGLLTSCLFYPLGLFTEASITGSTRWALPVVIAADVWQWTPFMMLIFLAGLQNIPRSPYEAAMVDGASLLQTFRRITLPLLSPVILIAMVIRLIDAFKIFGTVWILTFGGPGSSTEVVSLAVYKTNFYYWNMSYAATMGITLFLILLLACFGLFSLTQRKIKIF